MKTEDIKKMAQAWQQVQEASKLDPVNPNELKGTHAQRKDKDIDNDGDVDKSDEYLHNRRKTIKHAMKKEEVELDEDISKMSHSRLKWHMNTGVPHGSYTKDEMKKERDRRLKTGEGEAYRKAKPMLEKVELDELSDKKLDAYRQKAFADQPSGDDGSNKYRKRKFGRDLAFAKQTGRAKVLATKESVDLDEAVEVRHDRYMRSHSKKASGGTGSWMFTHKAMGDVDHKNEKEVYSAPSGKFSDAKKAAQQWAKKHGHSTVYVMEEVELDEAVTVKKKDYSWGKMMTVHHGSSHSFPLHPEHQEKIKKLGDGEKTSFRDETGSAVTAHREGDKIHLKHQKVNQKTTVARSHFIESVELDEISRATARSYIRKAMAHKTTGETPKKDRSAGVELAGKKAYGMGGKAKVSATEAADLNTANADKAMRHDCATHVEHAEWGKGQPIKGEHTIVETADGEGYVTHYDVMFEHGIEKNVAVEDLRILASESHMHANKRKKMKESNEWPVYARILEKRDEHTKGATAAEPIDSKASQGEKDFVAKHGGLDGNDSGIDGAKAAEATAKAATAGVKTAPKRPADATIGDKTMPKA